MSSGKLVAMAKTLINDDNFFRNNGKYIKRVYAKSHCLLIRMEGQGWTMFRNNWMFWQERVTPIMYDVGEKLLFTKFFEASIIFFNCPQFVHLFHDVA